MTTGKRIQQARKAKGLSQKQLGEKLDVSASMIGQYENDLRNPKVETLLRIAAALNVSMYYLSGGTDEMTDKSKTHWAEAVTFSDTMFENDDGEFYTFGSNTYLGKIASISQGLRKDGQNILIQIGYTMIDLDSDDQQRLADHAILLSNQSKYKKEPPQE